MMLSIVIPAHNEDGNVARCLDQLRRVVGEKHGIPYEAIVVDDNSDDATAEIVNVAMKEDPAIRLVRRRSPNGFGRAIRAGLDAVTGDAVVIFMADLSDDPEDVATYYHKLAEGYDCVYGSRFIAGSHVEKYPVLKRVINRIVNRLIQLMFWTRFNDLTNAFKAYRAEVIRDCGPYRASHFNLTLELSLSPLIRGYKVAEVPISWRGRSFGWSHLILSRMARRYLCTLIMLFVQRLLIADDLRAERPATEAALGDHRTRQGKRSEWQTQSPAAR